MAAHDVLVRVTIIDARTGKTVATQNSAASDLPDSFLIDTTLHFSTGDVTVTKAEPARKADFIRTRTLTLWVRPAQPGESILVSYVDHASGAVIETANNAATDLPDSFLEPLTVELAGAPWRVVAATPPLKRDFVRTGRLTIRVERDRPTAPPAGARLPFTVPTIEDHAPECTGGAAEVTDAVLSEDEWRQIEFVSEQQRPALDSELAAVRRTRSTKSDATGFSEVHVRSAIQSPLAGAPLPVAAITKYFGPRARRLRIEGVSTRVTGGFAIQIAGPWIVYGVQAGGRVEVLGLDARRTPTGAPIAAAEWVRRRASGTERPPLASDAIVRLRSIAEQYKLVLVDWCRGECFTGGDDGFDGVFAQRR